MKIWPALSISCEGEQLTRDSWFPIGFALPGGGSCGRCILHGRGWQILEISTGGRVLIVSEDLALKWIDGALIDRNLLEVIDFGPRRYYGLVCGKNHALAPVSDSPSPNTKAEAQAFAVAFRATRAIDGQTPLEDAIYVEKISRLLPTYGANGSADDVVLGRWLTGGVNISVQSFERLHQVVSWLPQESLKSVIETAGLQVSPDGPRAVARSALFELPGRPLLAAFFNEHIVDVVQNRERYKALGIGFPSAFVLHGPPGCGKTFAVEKLGEFLGWPSFSIDATSVASPYIHETSKKVAAVFDDAKKNAPSLLVIDEMEAFLADRESGSGHHRVEEVAEFLRRIPEAVKNEILVIAMTNRIELIDAAILRRGRFDHIIDVGYPSEEEILPLLVSLLSSLPKEDDLDPVPLASALSGRALSDVAFVVREGARRAARSGKSRVSQADLAAALESAPNLDPEAGKRKIGFI
jgi:cell division protease FtsH